MGFFIKDGDYFLDTNLGIQYHSKDGRGFPRTAIDLYSFILNSSAFNSERKLRVLEIGTGEIAFLANTIARVYPCINVDAIEIDEEAYENAIKNIHNPNMSLYLGDCFPEDTGKYDVIITNPPQMPMKSGGYHDSGGWDGLEIINNIIIGLSEKINKGGILIINVFDFLGVENSFGRKRTFLDLIEMNGGKIYRMNKIDRIIRVQGETFKNMDYIIKIAPEFQFRIDDGGTLYHTNYLLEIRF